MEWAKRLAEELFQVTGVLPSRRIEILPTTRHDGRQNSVTTDLVGRPGLDPGTLGLKVPCSSG
jgi:hypothetical protein